MPENVGNAILSTKITTCVGLEIEHYCSLLPPPFDGWRIVVSIKPDGPRSPFEHQSGESGESFRTVENLSFISSFEGGKQVWRKSLDPYSIKTDKLSRYIFPQKERQPNHTCHSSGQKSLFSEWHQCFPFIVLPSGIGIARCRWPTTFR